MAKPEDNMIDKPNKEVIRIKGFPLTRDAHAVVAGHYGSRGDGDLARHIPKRMENFDVEKTLSGKFVRRAFKDLDRIVDEGRADLKEKKAFDAVIAMHAPRMASSGDLEGLAKNVNEAKAALLKVMQKDVPEFAYKDESKPGYVAEPFDEKVFDTKLENIPDEIARLEGLLNGIDKDSVLNDAVVAAQTHAKELEDKYDADFKTMAEEHLDEEEQTQSLDQLYNGAKAGVDRYQATIDRAQAQLATAEGAFDEAFARLREAASAKGIDASTETKAMENQAEIQADPELLALSQACYPLYQQREIAREQTAAQVSQAETYKAPYQAKLDALTPLKESKTAIDDAKKTVKTAEDAKKHEPAKRKLYQQKVDALKVLQTILKVNDRLARQDGVVLNFMANLKAYAEAEYILQLESEVKKNQETRAAIEAGFEENLDDCPFDAEQLQKMGLVAESFKRMHTDSFSSTAPNVVAKLFGLTDTFLGFKYSSETGGYVWSGAIPPGASDAHEVIAEMGRKGIDDVKSTSQSEEFLAAFAEAAILNGMAFTITGSVYRSSGEMPAESQRLMELYNPIGLAIREAQKEIKKEADFNGEVALSPADKPRVYARALASEALQHNSKSIRKFVSSMGYETYKQTLFYLIKDNSDVETLKRLSQVMVGGRSSDSFFTRKLGFFERFKRGIAGHGFSDEPYVKRQEMSAEEVHSTAKLFAETMLEVAEQSHDGVKIVADRLQQLSNDPALNARGMRDVSLGQPVTQAETLLRAFFNNKNVDLIDNTKPGFKVMKELFSRHGKELAGNTNPETAGVPAHLAMALVSKIRVSPDPESPLDFVLHQSSVPLLENAIKDMVSSLYDELLERVEKRPGDYDLGDDYADSDDEAKKEMRHEYVRKMVKKHVIQFTKQFSEHCRGVNPPIPAQPAFKWIRESAGQAMDAKTKAGMPGDPGERLCERDGSLHSEMKAHFEGAMPGPSAPPAPAAPGLGA